MEKKLEKLMNIDFNTKTIYGDDDDDKYIETKIKTYKDSLIINLYNKNVSLNKFVNKSICSIWICCNLVIFS